MKIVFMGTPAFSVPTLQMLCGDGHTVQAVFTQPDRPAGRGKKLRPSPVKQCAETLGLPVVQPESLRRGEDAEASLALLKELSPELIVVVAYGQILPLSVLTLPKYGCINLHASILPRWRGAAPIQRAILAGDAESGVTAMQMAEGLDTGDMLHILRTPIAPDETADSLHDRLSALAAQTMRETLAKLNAGTLTAVPQDDALALTAAKITKEMSLLDFSRPAVEIDRTIRAVTGAAMLCGKRVKLRASVPSDLRSDAPAGTVIDEKTLAFVCGDGRCVQPAVIQAEGAKAMTVPDFLRGCRIGCGARFEPIP